MLKDPDANPIDYEFDWAPWLANEGDGDDTLASSTWAVDPAGELAFVTTGAKAPSFTDTTTTLWLTGGVLGKTYELTNHIVTAAGRQWDRTEGVTIREQ